MDTWTFDWGRDWLARLLGRNPLVRPSDRLESIVAVLALFAVVVTIPLAAAVGTSVKEARAAVYAQQAVTRHQVTATALQDSRLHGQVTAPTFDLTARWLSADGVHVGTVQVPDVVRAGTQFATWVDERGDATAAPPPPGRAATEAVAWAALSWLVAAVAIAAAVLALHRGLDRARYADWDRDLRALAGNDDGRASREA
ncbi:hypothetical protein [Mycolicibacterium sp. 050158]|uniref:Rv1733c family protein n=1 Tax=Mycolicibacterium sp. 050158 TaxID=3090602 RepID=UPI00299E70D8|nr:hypothetical protein [Mycolicibacterium sp. 050158]MDX1890809.1 hypothetical protein [Mycolicibacterium sp. 050158]